MKNFSKRRTLDVRLLAALACCCAFPLTTFAASDSAKLSSIVDTAIRPVLAKYDVAGMAVAVTVDGHVEFFNYGVASRETTTPVSAATLFEIGSISKTFTATLAAYAQVLGKLSLRDHPGKTIPLLSGSALDKATLLNLGTYTAGGLPLQFPDDVTDDAQMLDYFTHWHPVAAPGTQRMYSNPSLGLFGYITALSLHSDFADAMETQLLPRLGLHESYIRVPEKARLNYAWGYDSSNKPTRVTPGVFDAETYGMKSTAADMIRFVQVNIDSSKLDGVMQRALALTHSGFFQVGPMIQGLGWEQYRLPVTMEQLQAGNSETMIFDANAAYPIDPSQAPPKTQTLFNKTGSTNGFGAYVAFVPATKIGIVMLANKNFPIPARVKAAQSILQELAHLRR